ncbi:methyltransferase [Dethiosulfatarculus sandiegensis]|uniref:O-methyltransferase n=1 Tax=Dethiosulfatarculus sandiegensis TaxID=1429043 RepID=A0A0D2JU36_9BACT|nr:methyltransferase [Dethiosulfatarculus sandiegensis]KIX12980.1 O-methyltransferase [Dethiosulfatarculus sandiegensis]
MRKLPDIDLESSSIYEILSGRIKARVLLTGIELGVFDHLSAPRSGPEIAQELETHPGSTEAMLDSLACLGLIEKNNGLYRNTTEAEISLCQKSPAYVGEMVGMIYRMSSGALQDMTTLVKSGPPPGSPDMGDQAIWADYARSMANYQLGGPARKLAGLISKIQGFSSFERMLDLGGGSGMLCIAVLAQHPTMRGVVFDQPSVVKMTESFIAEYEMQDRMSVMGGDYTSDSLGEGYDLVLASATLNFVGDDLGPLMRKIHQTLKPGGVFVSLAEGITHEHTRPPGMILENLTHALYGQVKMFEKGEIARAMDQAGFSPIESRTVPTPFCPIEMDVGRKSG